MSKSNIMLQFLGALNKSKAEKLSEIGIRVDSIIKGIKSAPRPNYNIVEVSGFLEESKRSMAELMARTYEGFSKTMLPVLKSGSLPADSYEESDLVLADKGQIDELNRLRSDNERLKREFSSMQASTGRTVSAGVPHEQVLELRNQINEKDIELQQRDHKIQKLTVDFNYSQEQAQNYQYKAQQLETRANEYASRISTIQTQLDEQTRQKNYAQTQFESATKEIRSYREQIDGLQISLNRKDREITDLKDQIERVAELEDDNEKLKQGVLEAAERIKKSSSDLKDIQEQSRREINRKDEELRNLASLIDRSKEEKELLLIDSHETSKTVEYYRVQFEKTNSDLQKRVGELEAMEGQLKMLMAGAASAASSSQPTDPLKMLDNILETESQDAQLEELQRQVSVITEERNKALSDVKKLTSELSTLSSEISELTRSNKRLEADKSSLGRELDALKGEVESELQRREKTQELVNKYRSEKNEVEQRLQDLLVENEGLQARIDEVRHEYERKLKSTDDLDNRIKDLRSERERLEGQIEELTKEVKQRERENREVSQRISDRESELQEAEQKLANQQKILHEETRLKVDLKQRLEATLKDLEDTKFKLNEQMRTTTAEEQERSKLLETITEYRLREGGLQKQISQLDGKITDQISRMESLVQEMNLKDRQIEVHLARNKEINEVV
ncbi:MAG TPA: hypothetical protein VJ044_20710, partial [Candidatus Hodarchaeales archaeon]|nr:hypothetical protein [Candidatus Hodarchaeales archaeon]